MSLNYSNEELQLYSSLFSQLDVEKRGSVNGAACADLLRRSKLSDDLLAQIWQESDQNQNGSLNKAQFFVALRLIAVAQSGGIPSMANANTPGLPLPNFGDFSKNFGNAGSNASSNLVITPEEKQQYLSLFNTYKTGDYLEGEKARNIFMQSQLPVEILGQIWNLSDLDNDGKMTGNEFVFATWLIQAVRSGKLQNIPATLPPSLLKSLQPDNNNAAAANPLAALNPLNTSSILTPTSSFAPSTPSTAAAPSINPNLNAGSNTGFASISSPSFSSAPSGSLFVATSPPSFASNPRGFGATSSLTPSSTLTPTPTSASTPTSSSSTTTNTTTTTTTAAASSPSIWAITPEERIRFNSSFDQQDVRRQGMLNGNELKDFFMMTNLPPNVLGLIWGLSDQGQKGYLTRDEFVIALKLINVKLAGYDLTPVLHPDLVQSLNSGISPADQANFGAEGALQVKERRKQLENETKAIYEIEKKIETFNQDIEDLKRKKVLLEDELAEKKREKERDQARLNDLKTTVEKTTQESAKLKSLLEAQNNEINQKKSELSQTEQKIVQLQHEQQIKEEALSRNNAMASDRINQLRASIAKMRSELNEVQNKKKQISSGSMSSSSFPISSQEKSFGGFDDNFGKSTATSQSKTSSAFPGFGDFDSAFSSDTPKSVPIPSNYNASSSTTLASGFNANVIKTAGIGGFSGVPNLSKDTDPFSANNASDPFSDSLVPKPAPRKSNNSSPLSSVSSSSLNSGNNESVPVRPPGGKASGNTDLFASNNDPFASSDPFGTSTSPSSFTSSSSSNNNDLFAAKPQRGTTSLSATLPAKSAGLSFSSTSSPKSATLTANPASRDPFAAASSSDPFASTPAFSSNASNNATKKGTTGDPFASSFDPFSGNNDPFSSAASSNIPSRTNAAASNHDPFASSDPFGSSNMDDLPPSYEVISSGKASTVTMTQLVQQLRQAGLVQPDTQLLQALARYDNDVEKAANYLLDLS